MMLLKKDGCWGTLRTRWRLKRELARVARDTAPWILESFLPWHDPSRFEDPEWARDWVRVWDDGSGTLVRLDTSRIELPPSRMTAAGSPA